jgi:hypothetical protein
VGTAPVFAIAKRNTPQTADLIKMSPEKGPNPRGALAMPQGELSAPWLAKCSTKLPPVSNTST